MPTLSQPPSILSTGTVLTGTLRTGGDVRIDGMAEGEVTCANLAVGAGGVVRGDVRADTVTLRGRIEGTVHARHLSLAASARVTGEIIYQSLEAEPGARIEARFHRAASTPILEQQRLAEMPAREARAMLAPQFLAAV